MFHVQEVFVVRENITLFVAGDGVDGRADRIHSFNSCSSVFAFHLRAAHSRRNNRRRGSGVVEFHIGDVSIPAWTGWVRDELVQFVVVRVC